MPPKLFFRKEFRIALERQIMHRDHMPDVFGEGGIEYMRTPEYVASADEAVDFRPAQKGVEGKQRKAVRYRKLAQFSILPFGDIEISICRYIDGFVPGVIK